MPVKTRTPRSLAVSDGFRSFVLDQLSELEDVMPRSMFGGVGLYSRGLFFGILARDRLYLKVDDENRAAYQGAEKSRSSPIRDGRGPCEYLRRAAGDSRIGDRARRVGA